MGFNIGGMAAAYEGYKQGQDEEIARQQRASDIEYQKGQRAYQTQQQDRTRQQQAREDARRVADAAVPATRQVTTDYGAQSPVQVDDDGNAMPPAVKTETQAVPREEQIRQMAENARKAGAQDDWFKLTTEADKQERARVSAQFQGILAGADGKSPQQILSEAAKVWNSGSLPLRIGEPRANSDGSVTVDVTDRDAGTTTQRVYKDTNQVIDGLRALADPSGYAALQQKRLEAHFKAQEELAKNPYTIVPPGSQVIDKKTGRVTATNESGMINIGTEEKPILVPAGKAGAAGTTGTGRAAGKTAPTAVDDAGKIIDNQLKGDENLARAHAVKDVVARNNPDLSAGQLADIAVDAVRNRAAVVKPVFNPVLGSFEDTYTNPAVVNRTIKLGTRPDKEDAVKRLGGEDKVKAIVKAGLDSLPAAVQKDIADLASDPKKLQAFQERLQSDETLSPTARAARLQAVTNQVAAYNAVNSKGSDSLLSILFNRVTGRGKAGGSEAGAAPVGGMRQVSDVGRPTAVGGMAPPARGPFGMPTPEQARSAPSPDVARRAEDERQQQETVQATVRAKQRAAAALKSGSAQDLAYLQASSDFRLLDRDTKAEIFRRLNPQ